MWAVEWGGVFVLQPGSAEHRVGPGRFQVLAARKLAARGTRAIRFDRRGTGDSTPVRVGEPNLIFAEEWIDDVDSLIEHLVGDAPVAHVGLCSGAWVAARVADLRPTRLTVLLSPTYFKLHGMAAGGYAEASRLDQAGRTPFRSVKGVIRDRMPGWAWRIAARLQLFHDPETLLGGPPVDRGARSRSCSHQRTLATSRITAARRPSPGCVVAGPTSVSPTTPSATTRCSAPRCAPRCSDVLDLAEDTFPGTRTRRPGVTLGRLGMTGAPRLLQRTRGSASSASPSCSTGASA